MKNFDGGILDVMAPCSILPTEVIIMLKDDFGHRVNV